MTRIVAGSAGGRRIAVPPGASTRPTSGRTREALFNTLATLTDLDGARVLDLYAGSGAVGLEALSRGAGHALFVEADPRTGRLVRDNARALGLAGAAEVRVERVPRLVAGPPPGPPYDVIFADPPYALPDTDLDAVLAGLARHGWLAAGAVVVVERASSSAGPMWPMPLNPVRRRRYGDTTLWYGHAP
ncbi:MAG TPA: 16S rRNA (guanine(966)-N(2))-methyltransferase RsmD [Mycobacteriales bacterium]|nr:16S rRNA (guanine(966)-N(2))-methyltransferase RsmD [Mycobacteriales bacterium]